MFPPQQPLLSHQPMYLPSPFCLVVGHITTTVFNSMCALLCESRICSTLRQKDSVKGHTKMSYEGSGIFSLEKKKSKGGGGAHILHKTRRGQNWDQRVEMLKQGRLNCI